MLDFDFDFWFFASFLGMVFEDLSNLVGVCLGVMGLWWLLFWCLLLDCSIPPWLSGLLLC